MPSSLPIEDADEISPAFEQFWSEEQKNAFSKMVEEENLSVERTEQLIENYLFAERAPLRDEVLQLRLEGRPSVLKARSIADRILQRIKDYIETFVNGMNLA